MLYISQDWAKANELWLKAGELGCAEAYFNLGNTYDNGRGVDVDEEKAHYYFELAERWEVIYLQGITLVRMSTGREIINELISTI